MLFNGNLRVLNIKFIVFVSRINQGDGLGNVLFIVGMELVNIECNLGEE